MAKDNQSMGQEKAALAQKPGMKKILSTVGTGLFYLCMLLILIFVFTTRSEKGTAIGGYRLMTVLTGSMEPAIRTGGIIVIKQVDGEAIKVGDIITYTPDEAGQFVVTHRVIEVVEPGKTFITQGDANNTRDAGVVPIEHVMGRMLFTIPLLGMLMSLLRSPMIIAILIVVFGFLFIVKPLWQKGSRQECEKE